MAPTSSSLAMIVLMAVAVVGVMVGGVSASANSDTYPNSWQCTGQPNDLPPYNEPPTFVAEAPNGKLYTVGPSDNEVYLIHVYGTPYEQGYARGTLMRDQIVSLADAFLPWLDSLIAGYDILTFLPPVLRDILLNFGIEALLDFQAAVTAPYTPYYFFDEIQGIADATGLEYEEILRFQMFPTIIKASCSMMGAWGDAVNMGSGSALPFNGLVQLRALDWNTDNPMRFSPTVIVYHPNENMGNTYSVLTFSAMVGAISGYGNETAVCEKVWTESNETFIAGRVGAPWTFVLRDILQWDKTIQDAANRLAESKNTAAIFVGVGSHQDGQFNAFEYSSSELNQFGWDTPFPGYVPSPPQHPIIEDVVYIDLHGQPSGDPCTADLVNKYHGEISAAFLMNKYVSTLQTGWLHIGVFDFAANQMYVAVATQTNASLSSQEIEYAYNRQFLQVNMTEAFNEPPPAITDTRPSSTKIPVALDN